MDRKVLEERLRSLSGSQQSIESLSEFCVRNAQEAEVVVRLWQAECERSSPDKRLILLYLANDILQNCRKQSGSYSQRFVSVVPRVVRHLFKGGPEKVRKSLGRLVGIWEERKVLDPRALKAMKDYFKRDSKGPRSGVNPGEKEEASRKRSRPAESLVKVAREAEAAASRCSEWRGKHQKLVEQGIQSESAQLLEIVGRQLGFYGTALNAEIHARRLYLDLLKTTLQEQEQAEQRTRGILCMCKAQQEKVQKSMVSVKELAQRENYSPTPPEVGSPDGPSQQLPSSIPPLASQTHPSHFVEPGLFVAQPPVVSTQSGPSYAVQSQLLQHPCVPISQSTVGSKQEEVHLPALVPPVHPESQEEIPQSSQKLNAQYPLPPVPHGFDISTGTHPPPITSAWHIPQYPVRHNGDISLHSAVTNQLATGPQAGGEKLSNSLGGASQENQEEYGFSAATNSINQPGFGLNSGRFS